MSKKINDIISELSQPFPQYEATLPKGGAKLTYISWFNRVRILNELGIVWEKKLTDISTSTKRIYICELTIHAEDGIFTRSATGIEDDDTSSFGDPSSNAEAMAFSRATANFGLGLYLYDKEHAHNPTSRQQQAPVPMDEPVGAPMYEPMDEPFPDDEPARKHCKDCNVILVGKAEQYDTCWDCSQKSLKLCDKCKKNMHKKEFDQCYQCSQR